ncbi:MAG: 2-phosphosulfolactate phosphatase [Actinobacteria bacterium]|nr:2-phosphosulfolactate phosphatase [Actinomycetota bacterium]
MTSCGSTSRFRLRRRSPRRCAWSSTCSARPRRSHRRSPAATEGFLGSLLNLAAVCWAVRETGEDVVVLCAGFQQAFALDDAYCAGRIVELLEGDRTDAALAARLISQSFASPADGLECASIRAARPRGRHRLVPPAKTCWMWFLGLSA